MFNAGDQIENPVTGERLVFHETASETGGERVVFETIVRINREGATVLMVEQNAKRALAISHRGVVLELGRNRFEGTGQELLADPDVRQHYLGS